MRQLIIPPFPAYLLPFCYPNRFSQPVSGIGSIFIHQMRIDVKGHGRPGLTKLFLNMIGCIRPDGSARLFEPQVVKTPSFKFIFISADELHMGNSASGSWRVKKNGQSIGVIGSDSSVIAVLPEINTDDNSRIKVAYLMAAAPQLLAACTKIKEMLENSLIVTREGFVINCSEIRDTLLDATLRASGCRKAPDEP